MAAVTRDRVICYVDGFNLYFGLRESRLRRFYWLDVSRLAQNLLKPHQRLVTTKYFTARISGAHRLDSAKRTRDRNQSRKRQQTFLDALETLPNLRIFYGHYLAKERTCRNCNCSWADHEEKMTDVNIATELLEDAFVDRFDTALVVSADSDLVPPIEAVLHNFSSKRVVVAFPPSRNSVRLQKSASAFLRIGRGKLAKSLLANPIATQSGHVLHKPRSWN